LKHGDVRQTTNARSGAHSVPASEQNLSPEEVAIRSKCFIRSKQFLDAVL